MAKRGKILRDPHVGPGLLMVEGKQYPFHMEGVWRSDVPPKPGLVVEIDFCGQDQVSGICAVPEAQLAKEQAEVALAAARTKGAALAATIVAKVGLTQLLAAGALLFSWWFLPAIAVQLPFASRLEFTFWQVLGYLNSGNLAYALERLGSPSSGVYGFLAVLALAGPFLHHCWKDRRAAFGGLLPIAFMLLIALLVRSAIQNSFTGPPDSLFGSLQKQGQQEVMDAISLGVGAYLSLLASLCLAAASLRQLLAARARGSEVLEKPQRAAA